MARSLRVTAASAGVAPFGSDAAGDAARPALSRVLMGRVPPERLPARPPDTNPRAASAIKLLLQKSVTLILRGVLDYTR